MQRRAAAGERRASAELDRRLRARVAELAGKVEEVKWLQRSLRASRRGSVASAEALRVRTQLRSLCPSVEELRADDLRRRKIWAEQLREELRARLAAQEQQRADRHAAVDRLRRERRWLLSDIEDLESAAQRHRQRAAGAGRTVAECFGVKPLAVGDDAPGRRGR